MPHNSSVVGVVGLGSVGGPLLALLRAAGHEVIGVDNDPDVLTRVERRTKAVTGPAYTLTNDTVALVRANLVVEAVPEDLGAKTAILRQLHAVCRGHTVLVSTSTALPLNRLAIASGRPARTLGLRMLRPPTQGIAVEPLHTAMTDDDASVALKVLLDGLGTPQVPLGARPAADATAMLHAYLNRAIQMVVQGYAGQQAVDTAMRLGCGLPTGPLRLVDEIGLDTVHSTLLNLLDRTGDEAYRPAPMLGSLVRAGLLGRKSGQGFYAYDEAEPASTPHDPDLSGAVARVGIVGSGTMARGTAEAITVAGLPVLLVARGADRAREARQAIETSLTRRMRRGRITPEDKRGALERLTTTDRRSGLGQCDVVVEATAEDLAVKEEQFADLGARCRPGTLLATTTSSLSVAACAEASGRPEDVVGLHFFNPAPVMRLVELVTTPRTSTAAVAAAQALCERVGKTMVPCPDRAGFIVNHLLFRFLADAVRLLDGNDTDVERTDAAVEGGLGHPMGPFALLDTIGLDVSVAILRRLHEEFPDGGYAPPDLLEQLVTHGLLGRKSGQGFRRVSARVAVS